MRTRLIAWLLIGINLFQFIGVPLLPPSWAWTLIPIAFTSNTLWALIHEAIHGNLSRGFGQVLSCLFGSSFSFLKSGHLTHHVLNRTEEQLEVLKPGESLWKARLRYYFFLCGGLYLVELLLPTALAIKIWSRTSSINQDKFTFEVFKRSEKLIRPITLEAIALVLFLGASATLYGKRWWLLLAILSARGFFISWLDYIYHYGNPVGNPLAANNLKLPSLLKLGILNFNLHKDHHKSPSTPWFKLNGGYDGSYLKAAINVWKGPIPPSS